MRARLSLYLLLCVLLVGAASAQEVAPTATPLPLSCPQPAIADPDPTYFVGLGDVAFKRRDYTTAIGLYSCGIALMPDFAPLLVNRGFAYAALLDTDAAMADYVAAIALDETATLSYINRGTLYTQMGNFGLAINDFTLAVGLNPFDPVPYINRAIVHAIEGNTDLALADLEQAVTLAPDFPPTYAALGAVYSALAAQSYQRFVDVSGPRPLLPAGTPADVLTAIDDSMRNGDFSIWLSLLTPARR